MRSVIGKLRHHHGLMMILCCAVPFVLLVIAINFWNLSSRYLFWFMILLCPILHYFMMKDMHNKH